MLQNCCWRMVQNWTTEWCRTVLTNGAEQYWRMVQLYWWSAPLCFYCWSPVVLELTQRELRSNYGSWPVSEVRSLWKTQHTIRDNHILELALHTMKSWAKLEWWIIITKLFNNHLNYSKTLELVQKSSDDQPQISCKYSAGRCEWLCHLKEKQTHGRCGGRSKESPPFDDKPKMPCLYHSVVRTRRNALLGNKKSNWVRLGSYAAN